MGQKKLTDLDSVIDIFVAELKKRGIHPQEVLLYGSYAKGTADEWSDIDMVVISKDFESIPPIERPAILSHAAWPTQQTVEALGYTPKEIAKNGKDSILWEEIEKNHRVLYKAA
ncbi:MAG: nucleotidyltransferase domain-containing protein [Deltaproteobacteria bacterium]|nr:nucleotidyltransferase domain-containing protein [Deltaproteobacteria bacterium]